MLGAIVPEFDDMVYSEGEKLPTAASPILSLRLRPALLAGVAIVEHAGPGMLQSLQSHLMGENRNRFIELADAIIGQTDKSQMPHQLHLI